MLCVRRWGLTPRSSGEPTACRLAREAVLVIIGLAGQSSHRRLPLSSNVRQRRARSSDSRCPAKQPVHGPAFPQLARSCGLCSSRSRTNAVIQVATAPDSSSRDVPALRVRLPTQGDRGRATAHCRDLSLLQPFDAVHCVASQVVLPVCRATGYCTKPSNCASGGWNTWRTRACLRAAGGSHCPQATCAPTPYSRASALPNPSLKRRANGVPPGPRGRAGYHQPRGPVVTPSAPA